MRLRLAACLLLVLTACSPFEQTAPPTPTLPAPTATPKPIAPEDVANTYFQAWQQGQFERMYDLLSAQAQATTPREVFIRRYTNIRDGIGETQLTIQASPRARNAIPFQVTRRVAMFDTMSEPNSLPLVQDGSGAWKVEWQPNLIFTGLSASSTVRVVADPARRGRILDRNDKPLADNGSVLAVGVVPGEIKDEAALLNGLAEALGIPAETIKRRYQGGQPGWFMPITTRPAADRADLEEQVGALPGVSLQDRPARVYPLGEAAAHVVGYVGHPTADELRQLATSGVDESSWIGRAGLEAAAEHDLAGTGGGAIQIVDQTGRVLRTIARKQAVPGQDLHTSLDAAIQIQAATALADKIGSVVVMDPRDSTVLAMVSHPSFDPNRFVIGLTDDEWQALNGPDHPLVLRATESAYPTGSIFKVITMAAGLEKGAFKPTSTFDCGLDWRGLPGVTLHNWEAQGTLNLVQALTASCNPAFYEIGLALDRMDPSLLPGYARVFGLGQPTRIPGVHEVPGNVPDPSGQAWSSGDAVNLAIGQGFLLATPLQMANAYVALANGGAVVSPNLLPQDAKVQVLSNLKLSPTTSAAILDGMKRVTSTAQGTAYYAFKDEKLPIAAKTGSAENENPDAHAWFVGFLPPDTPSLAVLVMIEGGQHGGTVAAPVARQIIDFAFPLANR
jgi:penicillin-binding protein 2